MAELAIGFEIKQIEQAAISALLQWPEKCFPVLDQFKITSEHFLTPQNRTLFDAVNNFYRNGKPIDVILLTNELRELGILPAIGGAGYVTETWYYCCHSPAIMDWYCGIIEESFARRKLVHTCQLATKEAGQPGADANNIIPITVQHLTEIAIGSQHRKQRTLLEAVHEKLERMEKGEPSEDQIETGLIEIDKMSPLRRGDMPVIAGLRKAGKSILALSIALNVAKRKIPVLYFSLEDREQKVIDRLFAGISRIPISDHHVKKMGQDSLARAIKASGELGQLPIHIKDDVYDLGGIIGIARELKARAGIGLIVIDYAQLVRAELKDANREQQVAEVSRKLRLLAMELDTPLLLLSQLNVEGATRESKALENDCTALWRVDCPDEDEDQQTRSIVIPFQRNGRSGVAFKVTFLGELARIENFSGKQ